MTRRRWSPEQVGARDQILAILRDAAQPMSASAIGANLGYVRLATCGLGSPDHGCYVASFARAGDSWAEHNWAEHLGSGLDLVIRDTRTSDAVFRDLIGLRTAGLVDREKTDRSVLWSITSAAGSIAIEDMPELVSA